MTTPKERNTNRIREALHWLDDVVECLEDAYIRADGDPEKLPIHPARLIGYKSQMERVRREIFSYLPEAE